MIAQPGTTFSTISNGMLADMASSQPEWPIKSARKIANTSWVTRAANAATYGRAGLRVSDYYVTFVDGVLMLVTAIDNTDAKKRGQAARARLEVMSGSGNN